jgi:t-SNARE complex subunit (syntaxin)
MSDVLDTLDATNPKHQHLILSHLTQAINDLTTAMNKQTTMLSNIDTRITDLEIAYRHEESVKSVKAPFYRDWWKIGKTIVGFIVIVFIAGTLYQDYKTMKPTGELKKLSSKIELILDMHDIKH